jgi:hypothetical protein
MLMLFGQRRPRNVRKVPLRQRLTLAWQALTPTAEPAETDDEAVEAAEPRFLWSRIFTVLVVVVCLTLVVAVMMNLGDYLKEKPDTGNIATFDVSGAHRVTREQLIAASEVRLGSSLVTLDRAVVQRNIERLPWVARARVQQVLPSTLAIQVDEHVPFAVVLGKKLRIANRDGELFKEAEVGDAPELPILTGLPPTVTGDAPPNEADGAREVGRRHLLDLLRLVDAHAKSSIRERFPLSEVHWDPVLGTTLVSARDGSEIRLGRAMVADPERAFDRIGRLLTRVEERGEWLKYALMDDDLRPDRAVVRSELLGSAEAEAARAGGAGQASAPQIETAAAGPGEPVAVAGDGPPAKLGDDVDHPLVDLSSLKAPPEPAAKPDAKAGAKAAAKPGAKPTAKVDTKAAAKPVAKAPTKPAAAKPAAAHTNSATKAAVKPAKPAAKDDDNPQD